MSQARGSRKHHYVPQFMLRRFASGAKRELLWRLDKKCGKPSKCRPAEAAFIKDYYRLRDDDSRGFEPDAETILAASESLAAPMMDRMVTNAQAPPPEERDFLAMFFAQLASRGPLGQGRILAGAETSQRIYLETILESPDGYRARVREGGDTQADDEVEQERLAWLRLVKRGEVGLEITDDQAIGMMFGTSMGLAPKIAGFGWLLLHAAGKARFVLSDTPVTHYDPAPRDPTAGSAWSTSDQAETTIPMDPEHCLVICPGYSQWSTLDVEDAVVRDVNLRTYEWADRWLFGQTQSDVQDVRAMAKRRPERLAQVRFRPGSLIILEPPDDGGAFGVASLHRTGKKRRKR